MNAVATTAAAEDVVTVVARYVVIATAAGDLVDTIVPEQGVGISGSDNIFDPRIRVALGVVELAVAAGKSDGHATGGIVVRDRIDAVATVEVVSPATTFQQVIALSSVKDVGSAVAQELIVVARSRDVLDVDEFVALSGATTANAGLEVDGNTHRGIAVARQVDAAAAVEVVGAAVALEHVVAPEAIERVIAFQAEYLVCVVGADQLVVKLCSRNVSHGESPRFGFSRHRLVADAVTPPGPVFF